MGIYLNPGNTNYKEIIKNPLYVDKTMMIHAINQFMEKDNKYVCISRPRRFGKTVTGNMLSAYYSKGCDSRALFAPFQISSQPDFADKLNKYNVIKIDMNSEYQNVQNKSALIRRITLKIKREMAAAFPSVFYDEEDSLAECLINTYAATGETFILL